MSRKITSRWIADNAVVLSKIAAAARTGILAGKQIAARKGVLNLSALISTSSTVVTTQVTAAATVLTPRADLSSGLGVFTGAISNGVADHKIVIVRLAGTNEGVDDGSNNEVYGLLSESSGVYTLSYKKSDGSAYTFPGTTSIDFYFVEVQDLSSLAPEALLHGSVTGVVDALHATTLAGHLNGAPSKHDASEIDVEASGVYYSAGDLEAALNDLDNGIALAVSNAAAAQSAADAAQVSADAAQDTIDAHMDGGPSKHDASEIDVEGTGDYYAPGTLELALDTIDAALKVVADSVSSVTSEELRGSSFTLSGTNITNMYVDLPSVPKTANLVRMLVMDGLEQDYGVDFTIITDGSSLKRLTWDSAAIGGPSSGMVADLLAGDKLRVYWQLDA